MGLSSISTQGQQYKTSSELELSSTRLNLLLTGIKPSYHLRQLGIYHQVIINHLSKQWDCIYSP